MYQSLIELNFENYENWFFLCQLTEIIIKKLKH